ncbi:sporulation protein YhbH [Moorella sulfitireducens]|uniref:sporulation protein YhbH n=1 Tax=Neomoorella sulfitireducens TaxID=2972948 RepID=UPI0021AC679F|nr:sporulation protein YhbH [Moorella sulfitireducens]
MDTRYILSREDWSLHRKGYLDQQRHQEKVREALRKNLPQIITEESIIMGKGKKVVRIPIRSLEEYHFRFNYNQGRNVGQGSGGTRKGTIIGRDAPEGTGKGPGAGDRPGIDYYEAEVTLEEVQEMLFQDLELPNLQEKKRPILASPTYEFRDVRRKGLMGNLDKKRTLLENLKHNALRGKTGIGGITPENLRFKTWEEKMRYETSAVILAMMDTSGSMGTYEKYIARTFYFWMVRFLRSKYQQVEIVFIAHHTQAKEVTEEEFFARGESGGTRCSSAYRLALEIIDKRFPPADYNIYPFHFTDGDNLPSDNEACLEAVQQLLPKVNLLGYGEIVNPYYRTSTLMNVLKRIKDERLVTVAIKDKNEVYQALRQFFAGSKGRDAGGTRI